MHNAIQLILKKRVENLLRAIRLTEQLKHRYDG